MSLNLHVHGQGLEVTQALNDYTLKKFSKIDKHYNNIVSLHITLKQQEGHRHHVSGDIHLAPKKHVHADVELDDMYEAIDRIAKVLTSAVDKHHHKKMAASQPRKDELL